MEVQGIVDRFRAADNGLGLISREGLRTAFRKTDWGARVPDEVIHRAWSTLQNAAQDLPPPPPKSAERQSSGSSGVMSRDRLPWMSLIDTFVEWYRGNIFGAIGLANQSEAETLMYELADQNEVTPQTIENVRKKFDEFDTDGSGLIDYEEFIEMMCKLLRVDDISKISQHRLERFWREADTDGSGEIDFPEFCHWYLKNFSPDKPQMHAPAVDQGIIGSFYSSFQPSAARRNSFVDPEGD
jgi:hypothetical protein